MVRKGLEQHMELRQMILIFSDNIHQEKGNNDVRNRNHGNDQILKKKKANEEQTKSGTTYSDYLSNTTDLPLLIFFNFIVVVLSIPSCVGQKNVLE